MTEPAGLFVYTSVWSLAFRRDRPPDIAEVDALLAALCVRRGLTLLTTDQDFAHASVDVANLRLWSPGPGEAEDG